MPEYPEIEHYRVQLSNYTAGKRITDVVVTRENSVNEKADIFRKALIGRTILFIERRGKQLIFHLNDGYRLVLHLMLGGWLSFSQEDEKKEGVFQIMLCLHHSGSLYFNGLHLGYLYHLTAKQVNEKMKMLGLDPFHTKFTKAWFQTLFTGKRRRVKSLLTDQKLIAGIGNRYSDEICFAAKVHPAAIAAQLDQQEKDRLYKAIQQILIRAKNAGGYLDRPFKNGDKKTGGYKKLFLVYGRENQPCPKCTIPIVKKNFGGKKMFYCPKCQGEL